ncbi:SDR family NAD(P)-dependent oxidoreductase [Agromyces aurantiacus]|uniref:SDR family NAD(P)-dependent oxidoreductase n=1 Tax=Agromyces aurantiacus TaxID=165814 RepID=A0ABV9R2V1_9MICO|nr:SDR family oxidoreductase [Agromyces aurantiacus]MBM7506100.1 short-subunit dehydrogenase [Agromyces aurantiacus]
MTHAPRLALVTGASSGLGELIAERLAERGADLVLVARRRDRLDALAARLAERHGTRSTVIEADLARPGAAAEVWSRLEGATPDTLVNAAGFATHGAFAAEHPDRIRDEVTVNVTALVELTRAALPAMLADGHGAIVNIASTASFQPVPGMAVYAATKTFVRELTEAIAHEVRGSGVKVIALCPGATRTEFFDVVGNPEAAVGTPAEPAEVVDALLRALDRDRTPSVLVTGFANRLGAALARLAPNRLLMPIAARAVSYEPGSATATALAGRR